MGEFIKLISDAGDNPRFAVADAKQLLKLYEEQYAYLGDTLVNQIAKLLGGISDDAVVGEEKGARFLWAARMLKNPVSNCMTPVFITKIWLRRWRGVCVSKQRMGVLELRGSGTLRGDQAKGCALCCGS